MARQVSRSSATSTIVDHGNSTGESFILRGLRFASSVIGPSLIGDRIGLVDRLDKIQQRSITSACEFINDANRLVLRLEPDDEQGLQEALRSYVTGSTFITSALFGHRTAPKTLPVNFFGHWARVQSYDEEQATVPWFVVAVALAWCRFVGEMWTSHPDNLHLANETRSTLRELGVHTNNESLVRILETVSDDELRLSIDHLLNGKDTRNALDRSIQTTLTLVKQQVEPMLPIVAQSEIQAIGRSFVHTMETMSTQSAETSNKLDEFVGIELIGPFRLMARMSLGPDQRTEETHVAALEQLHHRIMQDMKSSVDASRAARETNKLVTRHREDVWGGNVNMHPAVVDRMEVPSNDGASTYHPSTLGGSLKADRDLDFGDYEENELEEDEEVEEEEDEEEEEEASNMEEEEGDRDKDQAIDRAIQERQRMNITERMFGLVPVSGEQAPLVFDEDSTSTYAPSSLGGLSKPWSRGAPSIASDHPSLFGPVTDAIAITDRSRDSGPVMIPAQRTLTLMDEKESEYAPSVLSGFSMAQRTRSAVGRLGRAPSVRSHVLPHAPPLLLSDEERMEDPMDSAILQLSAEATERWATNASASTTEDEMIIREGSTVASLMNDNETLSHQMSSHRAGEEGLVLQLTQAHSELGHVTAALVAKNRDIARLNETIETEREKHDRDVEQLQRDLESQSKVAKELQLQLNTLHARAAETTQYVDTIQRESVEAMEHLNQELNAKSQDCQTMRREARDLSEAVDRTRTELDSVIHELNSTRQQNQAAVAERDRLQAIVMQMTEEQFRRDSTITEMGATVGQLMENKQALESQVKVSNEEKNQLEARLEELQQTKDTEMERARSTLEELSRRNNDLEDSLRNTMSQAAALERTVTVDREGQQVQAQEKDRELLRTEEARQQLETALGEARIEANETQRVYEQLQSAILELRRVVGLIDENAQATLSMLPDQIKQVTTTVKQQSCHRDEAIGAIRRLADRLSVENGDTTLISEVVGQVISKIDDQFREVTETHRGLVALVNRPGATSEESSITSTSLSQLIPLAQARVSEVEERAEDMTRALLEVARITGTRGEADVSSQEVIDRVTRMNDEKMAMQRGLQGMAEVTVATPPLELIRLAQAKFRALSTLEKSYSEEVLSLRRRSDLLQESLDKAQLDYEREKASKQREIHELRGELNRLETQQLEKLREATRDHEERQNLDKCRALLENATRDLNSITLQKRVVEQKLAQREVEWQRQLTEVNTASALVEEQIKALKQRIRELEQASRDRDVTEVTARTESEARETALRQEVIQCQERLESMQQRLDQTTVEYNRFQEEVERERAQWQEQVETFNRQLAEAAPGEAITLRLERDQLKRELLDLNARLNHVEQTRTERDRLEAVNEQLKVRLEECERHRSFQDDLVSELKHQVATLEQRIHEADRITAIVHPPLTEPEFQEDEIPGLPSSSPEWQPGQSELDQKLENLGEQIAKRELELLVLDDKVEQYKSQLADILDQIENAEVTLAKLRDTIEFIHPQDVPPSLSDDVSIASETPPASPVSHFPIVNLSEWKERFPSVKPSYHGAKRWVLALGELEKNNKTCDLILLDNLLDPRKRFVYQEDLEYILRETLAFAVHWGGASLERQRQRNKALRGLDNLQRIALQAKGHRTDDAFRLAIVCELILFNGHGIAYEGAVLQRYCELVLELAMAVTFCWRSSDAQQRQRLILSERDLPVNDSTAIVVRFAESIFQTFDRTVLVRTLLRTLVQARQGKVIDVPVVVSSPRVWNPRESLWCEFEDEVPISAPTFWVEEQLDRAAMLVPGLVHVMRDQTIVLMEENLTYVQLARLDNDHGGREDCILLVGQRDSWVVVDPLSVEDEDVPQTKGMQLIGVIRAPQGVTCHIDRGFALMTWIREVFVHGMPLQGVIFQGQSDKIRCTLEHYFKCMFH